MSTKLVETKYGTGGKIKSKLNHKLTRFFRGYATRPEAPFDWTVGITYRPTFNIKNQFQSFSCWGQAYSRAMQIISYFYGFEYPELSAKSAYSLIYEKDGGVELTKGEDEALNIGLTTEVSVPSTQNGTCDEKFMEDTTWRSEQLILDSIKRAGYKAISIDINIESIALGIRDYGCVIFLVEGSNNGTWLSPIPKPAKAGETTWGHYVCSDSNIQPNASKIRFYNSWGDSIGENGFQYFDENYINSGHIVDCFALVKNDDTNQQTWIQKLLNLNI